MINSNPRIVVYGLHPSIIQNMLDYDFLIGSSQPSIAYIVSNSSTFHKCFRGKYEIMLPIVKDFSYIKEPVNILLNLSSFRSAHDVTKEAISSSLFSEIYILAEGVPERQSKQLIASSQETGVKIIGPSSIGAIVSGVYKIGNIGGSIENIMLSNMRMPGSIGLVCKSGGMLNEMCRIISQETDGIYAALSVGGDRFPGTTMVDVVLDYEDNPDIKTIVILGEVGGTDEVSIANHKMTGRITKPIVARVYGSSAELLNSPLQFGHAGAKANKESETESYKIKCLEEAGIFVPKDFNTFGKLIGEISNTKKRESIALLDKISVLKNRQHTIISTSISNETGLELLYNNIPISDFVTAGSIANVIGHLWLGKSLSQYALEFLNTSIILLADHGAGVSGALNTIITARAGKDLVSSLTSGLLTIGPRFGGAIDDCAKMLLQAKEDNTLPSQLVEDYKKQGLLIPGIGHKVKSKYAPDKRCELLQQLSKKSPTNGMLQFMLGVEEITLEKKENLILNVDGYIAAMFLDILTNLEYSLVQQKLLIESGLLNGIFIFARTIGLIGHYIDQKNINDGLMRLGEDHILYLGK